MYSLNEFERMMEVYNKYASILRECNTALERYKKADDILKKFEKMMELVRKYPISPKTIKRRNDSEWLPEDFFETDIEGCCNSTR